MRLSLIVRSGSLCPIRENWRIGAVWRTVECHIPPLNPHCGDRSIQRPRGLILLHDVAVIFGDSIVRTCTSTTCNFDASTEVHLLELRRRFGEAQRLSSSQLLAPTLDLGLSHRASYRIRTVQYCTVRTPQ